MGNSSKPRKAYRPVDRPANSTPMTIRADPESQKNLMLFPHTELVKYIAGEPTEESWHTIVARLNVGQVLAFRHFKEVSVQSLMREALDCMVAVNNRIANNGVNSMSKSESSVVGFALWFVDEIQTQTTRREFASALVRVYEVAAIRK